MPEAYVLAKPWRGSAYIRIVLPVIENACGYCGWEHPPRDHSADAGAAVKQEGAESDA